MGLMLKASATHVASSSIGFLTGPSAAQYSTAGGGQQRKSAIKVSSLISYEYQSAAQPMQLD